MPAPIVEELLTFLDRSPTPYHAVDTATSLLLEHGFTEVHVGRPGTALTPGALGFIRDGGSIFAFRLGRGAASEVGFRIVAAHTDSPNLRIKPQPVQRSHGYVRLGVEVYGGAQVATWVDRDLGLAGLVHVDVDGRVQTHLIDVARPVARIPTLAIHLNRTVNTDGLKLNNQTQLPAVFGLAGVDDPDPLRALLAAEVGCAPEALLTWDLSLYDLTPAAVGGANEEFVFSGRLDNLASCHAALHALLASLQEPVPEATSVVALFDHEEVGSRSHRGAAGRALEQVLTAILRDGSPEGGSALSQGLAHSWLVSADMAHAIHPGFVDKSDPDHAPHMNGGPAIKVNANQRYASEGETTAAFALLAQRADVPYQWFLTRADMACGSTVGPILSSRLGVKAVDVGNPMLSMHSAREQCGAEDHARMATVMQHFFSG